VAFLHEKNSTLPPPSAVVLSWFILIIVDEKLDFSGYDQLVYQFPVGSVKYVVVPFGNAVHLCNYIITCNGTEVNNPARFSFLPILSCKVRVQKVLRNALLCHSGLPDFSFFQAVKGVCARNYCVPFDVDFQVIPGFFFKVLHCFCQRESEVGHDSLYLRRSGAGRLLFYCFKPGVSLYSCVYPARTVLVFRGKYYRW